MTREKLFDALAGIDDRFISDALHYSPEAASGSSERIVHLKKKKLISFALAAALILALGVTVWAAYDAVATPQAAEKVAREQIAVWQELGLIDSDMDFDRPADNIVEIEEHSGGTAWYGRLFPHSYDVHWFFGQEKYGCSLNIDTLEGRIMYATFYAEADADAVPTGEIELSVGPDGETKTFYYYDNFDDLFSADMTVDGFCTALAVYWGYNGYRLADPGDPVYTEEYAAHFGAVDSSTRMLDVPWDMSGVCFLAVYFDGDAEGAPVYIDLMQYPGYVGLDVGIRHPVG